MASREAIVKEVDVGSAPIERFQHLLTHEVWSELERDMGSLANALQGHSVWNVNSTARGGGVAEMLAALIPYERGAGIDERWAVMEGSPEFFAATKKIHTLLHGVEARDGPLTDDDRHHYEQATARNAEALTRMIRPGDVAILHDPQTAGCVPALTERGIHVIWRSHIGVNEPNGAARDAWSLLRPYLASASALVFSRRAYTWEGLDESRVHIIAPCIDPFATKNQDFVAESMDGILQAGGLLSGRDGQAVFMRHDETRAQVVHSATIAGALLPDGARVVTQVSRWDRLKDPAGVLDSFGRHVAPKTDAYLVLAGPAATSVTDDPEQPAVLDDLQRRRDAMSREVRDRIVIAQLPMEDTDENAAIVNALQRRANVVVQKSLAEGFGLTIAEAMWKSRPVVASRVGGIDDQIEDGKSGILIDDPKDLEAFGSAVVRVLDDRSLAEELGHEARRQVIRKFITPCHLIQQARLVVSLLDH
jgi:trehalose synthase